VTSFGGDVAHPVNQRKNVYGAVGALRFAHDISI
jgi:hypothetical protein